ADIALITKKNVIDLVHDRLKEHRPIRLGVVNAAKLVAMESDKMLQEDVSSSDLVLADGMSVVWASHLLPGPSLPERIAGIDLMFSFLELANEHGYGVYCLGATEEILETVVSNIKRDYPNAVIAGARNGYFNEDDEEGIAAAIKAVSPHFLFVAMTSPKKENFMGRWGDHMNVPLVHGVGGSFDVYAGKVKRAPARWQKLGLEWLYRVIQEPRRLWKRYLITNAKFVWLVIKQWLGPPKP
ncbi:MAG: N-acetylglucosaminyldiphosphoundecaprenol N-acetyl-beta-D-mannosaminyltransferase, partial [Candidatus Azotimanducaceae bacterium]